MFLNFIVGYIGRCLPAVEVNVYMLYNTPLPLRNDGRRDAKMVKYHVTEIEYTVQ